jgi:hypothetical protein
MREHESTETELTEEQLAKVNCGELGFSYFKQGDDMGFSSDRDRGAVKTLEEFAELHRGVADETDRIKEIVSRYPEDEVSIHGDTHFIMLSGPNGMIRELLAAGLIHINPDFCEDE